MVSKFNRAKVCVDIGGTKTLVALVNKNLRIIKSFEFPTFADHKKLFETLETKLRELSKYSDILNIAIAARLSPNYSMGDWVDPPLKGISFKGKFTDFYKRVSIENDGNCFAMKELMRGI